MLILCSHGYGNVEDCQFALTAVKKAAEKYGSWQQTLGEFYAEGWTHNGVTILKKDIHEAERWYKMAINNDYKDAILLLGNLYADEYNNLEEAEKMLIKGVEEKLYKARMQLGLFYFKFVDRDKQYFDKAYDCFTMEAFENDDTYAMEKVGDLHRRRDKEGDIQQALNWYEEAARRGNMDAKRKFYELYQ